jgi:hypothetical protein
MEDFMFIMFKGEDKVSSSGNLYDNLMDNKFDALTSGLNDMIGFSTFNLDSYPVINSIIITDELDDFSIERIYKNSLKALFRDLSHSVKIVNLQTLVSSLNKDISLPFLNIEEKTYIDIKTKTICNQFDISSLGSTTYSFNCNLNLRTLNPHLLKDKLKKWLKDDFQIRECVKYKLSDYHLFKIHCLNDLNITLPCHFLRGSFNYYKTFTKYMNYDKLIEEYRSFTHSEIERAKERYDFLHKVEKTEWMNDAEHDFDTLAGFILHEMKEIPSTGDKLTWRGFEFEIVDMDKHRIDKVLVTIQNNL